MPLPDAHSFHLLLVVVLPSFLVFLIVMIIESIPVSGQLVRYACAVEKRKDSYGVINEVRSNSHHITTNVQAETKNGQPHAKFTYNVPPSFFEQVKEIELPLLTIPSRHRANNGNFFLPSQVNMKRQYMVIVFIDPADGVDGNLHAYVKKLSKEHCVWTVMLPVGGAGIRYSRQCIKLFMEAVLQHERYNPAVNVARLRVAGNRRSMFDCYFMLDDDIGQFKFYESSTKRNVSYTYEEGLLYLWNILVAEGDKCSIVGSCASSQMRSAYYKKYPKHSHRASSRVQQVILINRKTTKKVAYASDKLMILTPHQWRWLDQMKSTGRLSEEQVKTYFQGEDWSINGQLVTLDLPPFMTIHLWHSDKQLDSVVQTRK